MRTTGELKRRLSEVEPEGDPDAMAYAVRSNLPLVQVPPGGTWGSGSRAAYTTASVSGRAGGLRTLLLRYLAAFGPATVMDFQSWSGMVRLKPAVEDIKPELRVFRDQEDRELLDAPDAPLPPPESPRRRASCRSTTTCSSPTPTGRA